MNIDVNGTRLWFDVDGPRLVPKGTDMVERPTVVLLHGGPGGFDHSYFKPDFDRLSDEAQVVYLDLRGHGRSEHGDPRDWNFEVCADDVRLFCDALDISRPIVYGHSLGGFIALLYGIRHPGHAAGLVLQSSNAKFDLVRVVEEFRRIGGDEIAEIVRRSYTNDPSVTVEEWVQCWELFGPWVPGDEEKARIVRHQELNEPGIDLMRDFDVVAELGKIVCPALICVGELDPIMPMEAAQEIAEGLRGDLAQLEIMQGAGHFPWRDAPELYWPLLVEFIRRVWSRDKRSQQGTAC